MLQYEPAGHSTQRHIPGASLYEPSLQDSGAGAPIGQYAFGGHKTEGVTVPEAHNIPHGHKPDGATSAISLQNEPAGHGEQSVIAAAPRREVAVPMGHGVGSVTPAGQ